ncbi:MAG: DUF2460 domain-containing protein [Deltaproteobacteria bacterium]|nr:DUF2460 domain-containing protein [Deltaproteobacteria bacterium]
MFLEERISVDIKFGATYADDYEVDITTTSGGAEYRRLVHPYPTRKFKTAYVKPTSTLYADILNLYHRAYGKYAGFRAKALDDFTTNGLTTAPTSLDQTLTLVSSGVYQLLKKYGTDKTALSIGHPKRIIYKPVAGTVLTAVGGIDAPASMWSVDTTTGKITFGAKSATITGISKAAAAVVSFTSHPFLVGESVYFSGVVGMTQINALRGLITATTSTTITVAINSTAFSVWTSGGTAVTTPQAAEVVTGGCEFDIPVRFDVAVDVLQSLPFTREISVDLVELLNP